MNIALTVFVWEKFGFIIMLCKIDRDLLVLIVFVWILNMQGNSPGLKQR